MDASQRSGEQLGVYGDGGLGVEFEGVVWVAGAGSGAGLELVRMEFRRFLHAIIVLPVQIIRAGRKMVYRLLGYNAWLKDFFATWQRLQKLEWVE